MSSSRDVLIAPTSLEVLFQGCLLKAPPLNRRGRKKWHERYFVLRANRTLECHKSKKAVEARKSPRRIVDLRECINLEIGLEYKNLQHIMSLGTFKRTFFYAAPSDPLMLQWTDVLEKAKNAKDGEYISILDIGLRRTKDIHAVHNVKPSPSQHSLANAEFKKTSTPASKSAMALSHFSNSSADTVDLRQIHSSHGSRGSELDSFPSIIGSPSNSVFSSEENGTEIQRGSSISSAPSNTSGSSAASSPVRTMSGLANTSPSRRAGSTPIFIPNKVPPPSGVLIQASRDKDGFFINQKKKDYGRFLSPEITLPEEDEVDVDGTSAQAKEFVPKEGHFKRAHVIRGPMAGVKAFHPTQQEKNTSPTHASGQGGNTLGVGGGTNIPNLRRSFRYRKIALRKEYEAPLYTNREESESDDDGDTNSIYQARSAVPGPQNFLGPDDYTSPVHKKHPAQSNLNEISPADEDDDSTKNPDANPDKTAVVKRRTNVPAQNTSSIVSYAGYSGSNYYSKVTVAGPRRSSSSSLSSKRPLIYKRSNSQSAIDMKRRNPSSLISDASPVLSRSFEDSLVIQPPAMFADSESGDPFSPGPGLALEALDLPSRPPSDSYLYGSHNSLDNILDPPTEFNADEDTRGPTRSFKRKLSRTRKVVNPKGKGANEGVTRKEFGKGTTKSMRNSVPKQNRSQTRGGGGVPDRDSTESSDTGYTSSTSPGYNSEHPKGEKEKIPFQEEDQATPKQQNGAQAFSFGEKKLRSIPSLNSLASSSSELLKFYVPLVFHSNSVQGAGVHPDHNLFSIQVCLVENSDELIKDLVSLKSLESFSLVDCDEIHGEENVTAGDDFTVQTSLEDLEFGFSIVKSTEKDLFMRKVRQFTFEVKNLFGTSKPFSCDVEIRHADQLTVLPIEVM